jgi:hypothetical protein
MTTFDRPVFRRALAVAIACGGLLRAAPAQAQGQDEAAARSLFDEGRQFMKAGRYPEACSKLEAARKLFTSSGLLLNLADCHERTNRTATAWAEFGDAAYAASTAGRPRDEAEAKRRQAALKDRLSRLAIVVDGAVVNEVVKRDGEAIDRSAWGVGIPIDPGTHVVAAEAPGRQAWVKSIEVKDPSQTVTVQVPALDGLAASSAPAPAVPAVLPKAAAPGPNTVEPSTPSTLDRPRARSVQRVVGWTLAGVGVAAMGASGILGLVANSQFHQAEGETGDARHTDSVHAGQLADVGTVVLVAGGVVAGAGLVVWLTAPKAPIAMGMNGPSLVVSGRF